MGQAFVGVFKGHPKQGQFVTERLWDGQFCGVSFGVVFVEGESHGFTRQAKIQQFLSRGFTAHPLDESCTEGFVGIGAVVASAKKG